MEDSKIEERKNFMKRKRLKTRSHIIHNSCIPGSLEEERGVCCQFAQAKEGLDYQRTSQEAHRLYSASSGAL